MSRLALITALLLTLGTSAFAEVPAPTGGADLSCVNGLMVLENPARPDVITLGLAISNEDGTAASDALTIQYLSPDGKTAKEIYIPGVPAGERVAAAETAVTFPKPGFQWGTWRAVVLTGLDDQRPANHDDEHEITEGDAAKPAEPEPADGATSIGDPEVPEGAAR